ncbi:MAG TPA: SpoIIE family protein phosphatase [Thermoanaerobaculia bacterium]|jgi:serine phosphatase RsbU (regulator of sigma subunit)|nr:SpoIIE family protein phosphatase [Thermoanaerobaculia bacterium]
MDPRPIRLTVLQPNLAPMKVDAQGSLITLGRAVECTVPIKDRYLSRRHAEIVFAAGEWVVRDCGSVNGTTLNGARIVAPVPLRPGDRIALGDSEVIFEAEDLAPSSKIIALDSDSHAKNLAIPIREIDERARTGVLASLAVQFIDDRSMNDVFEFILDRVMELLQPSRAALALFGADRTTFNDVHLRRSDSSDSTDLFISKTLLGEVVEGRNVVSFVDTSQDDKLARAQSIVAQNIRSAVCAPLIINDVVLGVLYLDFQAQRGAVTHDDVHLIAQIARFAAVKLETTRLRVEALAKARLDEELRTAYTIQSRLLPAELPVIEGYSFAGSNVPARAVSGDYYDVVVRPDGRMYFIIADVSGKGITAALVMSSVATAFSIFTRTDPSPADLVSDLNATLAPKTAPTKFVTLVAGVLDPKTGDVDFANAGHVAPLVVTRNGVEQLKTTDMVVGLFAHAKYRNQRITLGAGDSIVLFTDGVTEAENPAEDQLGIEPVAELVRTLHAAPAPRILESIEAHVREFVGDAPAGDDVTMLALTRS